MALTGSNLDAVRRQNLSAVLEQVHRQNGASRAELTAATGLNRSTVAALVAELALRRLVEEGEPGATSRVGRPSLSVMPHPDVLAIAINPEIDAVSLGVVGLGARVLHRERRPLDAVPSPERAVEVVVDLIESLPPGLRRASGIGVAVPGLVRADDGLVRWAPHLGWTDVAFTDLLTAATGLPAYASNDAGLAAVAEHRFGVGRGIDDLIYLNGGASGIGGGVIVDGRRLGGANGYAGEFGHNRPGVPARSDRHSTGGALEDEVTRERLLEVLRVPPGDESKLTDAATHTRDRTALAEIARQRRILATALSNAVNVLNPSLIVLGGFLATILETAPDELLDLVRGQSLSANAEALRLEPAALGADRLLIGAAELVFAPMLLDPAAAL